ncbi:choice-of-anchor P family protein [Nocardioides sp. TF02-7]|uniref:choice-of-anchor P family protein n=1 Tax=Nocardioides sp. TF02-7 TaxID=2917724 RepID=UPI001F05F9EA|nr:choice-of-anchor P family protein [Nocardioides sp. TF02-7]UMG94541.1 hypothetical protein MF408_11615 [Nocardioides sp. TF02-7]
MRRIALLSAVAALTCSTLFQAGTPAQAAPAPADVAVVKAAKKKAKQVATPYALRAVGHGTYINGGDLPLTSGATGQAQIACTTIAGVTRSNRVAGVDVPGLGRINGVRTRVWTKKKNRTVSSYAQHDIADIKLLDAGVFSLSISGLQSRVRVWKNPSGYHAKADTKILSLKLTAPGIDPIELSLPSLNQPITLPGVLQINAGEAVTVEKKRSAFARAQVLQIKVLATNTTIRVGLSRARITDGIVNSAMGGFAAGLRAQVLPPLVGAGRTPVKSLPCQGTDGKALRDSSSASTCRACSRSAPRRCRSGVARPVAAPAAGPRPSSPTSTSSAARS